MTQNTPVQPPAPAHQPPSATGWGSGSGHAPGSAQGTATGGAVSPSGTSSNQPPTSGAQQGGGNQTGGTPMSSGKMFAAVTAVFLVGAAIVGAGLYFGGCGNPPAPTPPAPPAVTATPPAPPPTAPTLSSTLTPDDANKWAYCGGLPDTALRWFAIGPSVGDESRQMLIRICNNPIFAGKPERIVLKNGVLMVSDGEGESGAVSLDVSKDLRPGGFAVDRWSRLSAHFPGRRVIEGTYKGGSVTLVDPLIVFLGPSSEKVLSGTCEEWRLKEKPPVEEKWMREIWIRCQMGTPRQTAIATTMIRTCGTSGCYSKDDGSALDARVRAVEEAVKKNGDKPVAPVAPSQVDFDPSAPAR